MFHYLENRNFLKNLNPKRNFKHKDTLITTMSTLSLNQDTETEYKYFLKCPEKKFKKLGIKKRSHSSSSARNLIKSPKTKGVMISRSFRPLNTEERANTALRYN